MESAIRISERRNRRLRFPLVPIAAFQSYAVFTIWSLVRGGENLRAWLLSTLAAAMALPLLVSLETCLMAILLFEPLRGILRRAQYLIVDYTDSDPIHLVS